MQIIRTGGAKTPALLLATACLLGHSVARSADLPPMKPGLWELTQGQRLMNGKPLPDASSQMAEQLAKMPPQMRQQIEAKMKANGVQLSSAGGAPSVRMCIPADMLARNAWQKAEGQCTTEATSHTGNTWNWKVKCTEPKGEGEGSSTFSGPEAFTSKMHMTMAQGGQTQTMDMTSTGRWLSADCGGIKPMKAPQKK